MSNPWPKWFRFRYYSDDMHEVGHTCSVTGDRDIIELFDWLQLEPEKIIEFQINQRPLSNQEIHELFRWVEQHRPQIEEGQLMKNGKKPTKKQKEAIKKARLNPDNWLVVKNLTTELHLVHRTSGNQRVIPA
ncbi:hypothetical protein ISX45_18945 (plasmid) [Anoxybacillus caldiproteolyticus]|nr:hypothetical protein [Anoxybacillus caldiproteolyticus]QPA33441.1 hypothetical protein ISX45_18945 [Anoxybacillus caldiproteolyticus]